jgi:anti-anti-sigma regulatory factor
LIEIIEKLNESGGKMVFTNLDPSIDKTFLIMGLYQFAQKVDRVEEALNSLSHK